MPALLSRRRALWAGCTLVAAATLSLTLVGGSRAADAAGPQTLKGKPAPDFTLATASGESVTLAAQKGKVVLIDFWATWCGPCVQSLPHIESISKNKELADKGLVVYAVNLQQSAEEIKRFLEKKNLSLTVPMDVEGATAGKYQVLGIPTTVVVGRDGKVHEVFVGSTPETAKQLEKAIDAALSQKAPA